MEDDNLKIEPIRRYTTLPVRFRRNWNNQELEKHPSLPPCGDELHRPCPFCHIKQIDGYQIIEDLGTGSYSKVYLVKSRLHSDTQVLKVLIKSDECKSLYESETKILKELNHPNIIKMYNHFETSNLYCIALEYIPGRELFDIISNNHSSLTINDKKIIFRQIVSVVSYLHSLNIVHRDLKAENILVTESKVTIIDFGFAGKIDPFQPLCIDRRGSAEYISPEIVMSTPSDPRKSDIWSLGVILFTLLTGSLPFLTPTTKKTFHKIARGDYSFPDPSKYPESAISLVKSLLVTSTENRPTAEWILSSEWLKE